MPPKANPPAAQSTDGRSTRPDIPKFQGFNEPDVNAWAGMGGGGEEEFSLFSPSTW